MVFVGDERVLYDVLLGGIIGASSGAMMGVLCVEYGYRIVVLPIISELVHLQHGLDKFKTGKLVYSHSKIHSAIVSGIVSTRLAVQITETCSQALNGGFYDATILHVLGVFCMALIWKATRRDLVYGVYGAATVVVVQVLEDAMQVKDSQVILISMHICLYRHWCSEDCKRIPLERRYVLYMHRFRVIVTWSVAAGRLILSTL